MLMFVACLSLVIMQFAISLPLLFSSLLRSGAVRKSFPLLWHSLSSPARGEQSSSRWKMAVLGMLSGAGAEGSIRTRRDPGWI